LPAHTINRRQTFYIAAWQTIIPGSGTAMRQWWQSRPMLNMPTSSSILPPEPVKRIKDYGRNRLL